MNNVKSKHYRIIELLTICKSEPNDDSAPEIVYHLTSLKAELKHMDMECYAYIANPFSVGPADQLVGSGE